MFLVTGGAGFIGSNVVAALSERGSPVTVCDRLRQGEKWRNLAKAEITDFVQPEKLDEWLAEHVSRIEAVVHLGAISSTTETNADLILDVNFRLSSRLWHWCTRHGKPLIYASSAATYGCGEYGFDDVETPEALARLRPLNAYGWSKHLFDRRVLRSVANGEPTPSQWVGLKFFNVFGPNEYHKGSMKSVIAQKYPAAVAGGTVTLFKSEHRDYPDGGQQRDFIFVEDCVDVILWLLARPTVSGLFNLGSGRARSFEDLALALFAALGQEPRIAYVDMPEMLQGRYQYFTEARMERLRDRGYTHPFTNLEDGVTRYVQGYLSRPDPYR